MPVFTVLWISILAFVATVHSLLSGCTATVVGRSLNIGGSVVFPALSFVSSLLLSNELSTTRAITPIDFSICHLCWLELLFRSIQSLTLRSVFNYLLLL